MLQKKKGEEFLNKARELNTPVTSYSSIAHSYATFEIKKQLSEIESKENLLMYGPIDLNSKYGGVFFYGPHLIEPLIYIIDSMAIKVRVNKNNGSGSANIIFDNGTFATLIFQLKIEVGKHSLRQKVDLSSLNLVLIKECPLKVI